MYNGLLYSCLISYAFSVSCFIISAWLLFGKWYWPWQTCAQSEETDCFLWLLDHMFGRSMSWLSSELRKIVTECLKCCMSCFSCSAGDAEAMYTPINAVKPLSSTLLDATELQKCLLCLAKTMPGTLTVLPQTDLHREAVRGNYALPRQS